MTGKTIINNVKGFIFDLDGTLIDTTPLVIKHWQRFAQENGLDAEKILETSHGKRTIETIAQWKPELATLEQVNFYEQRLADETDGLTILPGVTELLKQIPNENMNIYTSGTILMAETRLKQLNMFIPKGLMTGCKVEHGKPHPEGYIRAANLLNLEPKDCIVFEDAPAGIQAGKSGGMKVIACCTTHTKEQLQETGADYIVSDLTKVNVIKLDDGTFNIEIEQ
ncbi:HAD hydrolase, family IA, variant 3 [Cunninghamella echinulata]|nr:HAD hydrolase, family IA, variant 3 [Cunninghamella echinulata]